MKKTSLAVAIPISRHRKRLLLPKRIKNGAPLSTTDILLMENSPETWYSISKMALALPAHSRKVTVKPPIKFIYSHLKIIYRCKIAVITTNFQL